jgi:hypothetical protein
MSKSLSLTCGTVLAAAGLVLASTVSSTASAPAAAGPASPHRSVCADRSLLFCEDFEKLPLGGAASLDWGIDTHNGTLTVDRLARRTRSHHHPAAVPAGHRQGLRVHTEGNGRAFMVANIDPPDNSFYGRLLVKVAAFPTAPDWAHYTLVEASGQGAGVVRPIGGQYVPTVGAGTPLWGVGSDGGPTGDWTSWQESAPSVADRWQCLEWHQDATDNAVDVWIDGKAQPDLSVSTTDHGGADVDFVFPDFDTVKIGWQLYQGDPTPAAYDLWLDDVALGTERIGCRL